MTHGSAAFHTVAYLWKPVKPRWQTVWYAAIRSGGGGWAKAACKPAGPSARRRWAAGRTGSKRTGLHEPEQGASKHGRFQSFLCVLTITTNLQIQGGNIKNPHIFVLWIMRLLSLFPSISFPSILTFLYTFLPSGSPNYTRAWLWWLPIAHTLCPPLSCVPPFFSLVTVFLHLSWKICLVSISQLLSCLWLLSVLQRQRGGDCIVIIQIRTFLRQKGGAINNFPKIAVLQGTGRDWLRWFYICDVIFCAPLISSLSNHSLCFCTLKIFF